MSSRAELDAMRLMALHERCVAAGIETSSTDDAMESGAPKQALIALLLDHQQTAASAAPVTVSTATLLMGSHSERSAAYATLEATQDVELAAASVEPLCAILGSPASETDAAEYRRVTTAVLAHLVQLDPTRIGGEWVKDMRALSATAKGNVIDGIASKAPEELNKEDARMLGF